jgi:hypothetical protein
MSEATLTRQEVCQQIQELPDESLGELARFVEFLQFKTGKDKPEIEIEHDTPFHPLGFELEGLFAGYNFSPKFIADAREEMWGNFPRDIEFDSPVPGESEPYKTD